jgi:hypothetical protein
MHNPVFIIIILGAVLMGFILMMQKKGNKLVDHMKNRRIELRDLLVEKLNGSKETLMNFVNQYTPINEMCPYQGPIPEPSSLSTMSAKELEILDSCGAVRSILNSWAISAWSKNAIVSTMENLEKTMNCVNKLSLDPKTYNNLHDLVTQCFNNVDIVIPNKKDIGPPYNVSSYNSSLPLSGGSGWRPKDYFNYNSQGSELIDGTDVLMNLNGNYYNAGQLQGYQLPRLSAFGPYMSRSEIDAEVLPRYEPSQWIVNNGPVRPWEPRYPIMTIPPTPIPLLGTSNM